MKLLFDQNISFRIQPSLDLPVFTDCRHVSAIGLNDCDDPIIWQFAKDNGFTIVTFDADFFDLSVVRGVPPKIIWFRTGNLTTSKIARWLMNNHIKISSFIDNPDQKCLEIFNVH
jgi:predicted nuclease of predicted toxin-antitoxin system